jgi:ethanolamine utilization microcompartment shell protein EutL
MMHSAEEFVRLRLSNCRSDYLKAATDSATVDVWLDVIRRFPEMKVWVAHNKTVPIEILLVLAGDHDSNVRAAVAMKNKLSEELFTVLAGDADGSVRQRIAYNKNTPVHILRRLSLDTCELIAAPARSRINRIAG